MNISDAAKTSGLTAKAIRYYERVGLIAPAMRHDNGYRDYSADDIELLKFVQRARSTGFSVEESRLLLQLYQNPERRSAEVHALVEDKLKHIDEQLNLLQQMRSTLGDWLSTCPGNDNPDCSIIKHLAEDDHV